MSTATVRSLIIGLYVLYPLGCILQLVPDAWGGGRIMSVVGLLLLAVAFLLFAILAGSSLQRQTQEPESVLDERESAERNRATFLAYSTFSGVVLLGVIYIMLTTDLAEAGKLNLWRPSKGEHWNAIFWGLILMSFTLPGAILAFGKQPPEED
ncbi:MAG: hypothetical protein ACK4HR_00875 [Hyphomonas sp.]